MGECLIMRKGGDATSLPTLNAEYPKDVTIEYGNSATFEVKIDTDGKPASYSYQWYQDGVKIEGANSATYTFVNYTKGGTYSIYCDVINKAGAIQSKIATFIVGTAAPQFSYTGKYEIVDEGNSNWKLKFLTSGTFTVYNRGTGQQGIDVFLVGGGAGGNNSANAGFGGAGGGGGYTTNAETTIALNTGYSIVVGDGGSNGNPATAGGASTAFGYTANGGKAGDHYEGWRTHGGAGGSGGGAGGYNNYNNPGAGGSNGGNGGSTRTGEGISGGAGQGTTTREFGDSSGTLYAGGGAGGTGGNVWGNGTTPSASGGSGGGGSSGAAGAANTGGGGGGGNFIGGTNGSGTYQAGGKGGSGIVIIRNKR